MGTVQGKNCIFHFCVKKIRNRLTCILHHFRSTRRQCVTASSGAAVTKHRLCYSPAHLRRLRVRGSGVVKIHKHHISRPSSSFRKGIPSLFKSVETRLQSPCTARTNPQPSGPKCSNRRISLEIPLRCSTRRAWFAWV